MMRQATILVTLLIQSDLAALHFKGGGDGYSLFALNCASQAFTDRTELQKNLYTLKTDVG